MATQTHDQHRNDSIGEVRVANEVVAQIAALAALRTEGVAAMYHPGAQSIDRLRHPRAHRGVRVEMLDDGALRIDCWIAMHAGSSVPGVGAAVQRGIADSIDRMLGLSLSEVNVYISEVVFV